MAGNSENGAVADPDIHRSTTGVITSHGYNVIGNNASAGLPAANNLLNVDPLLDTPRHNGGPTLTMQLLPGSPAIGFVPAAECEDPSGTPLDRDQRGAPRPGSTGTCDAGAYQAG